MKSKPVLGFANQKGGVGKTTWSKIFSEYLAIVQNKETLGIDIDSQTSFINARFYSCLDLYCLSRIIKMFFKIKCYTII